MRYYILFMVLAIAGTISFSTITLDLEQLGKRIWHNEANQKKELLTFWNPHEPFPSFGIGHCIWFPKKYHGPYTQTFPDLIAYLKKNGTTVPPWLLKTRHCPWADRTTFYDQFNSPEMVELRQLLADNVAQQTSFIIERLKHTITKAVRKKATAIREKIVVNFNTLAHTNQGMYALIDYFNFKGSGTNPKESYQGHRWGLLQLLESMESNYKNAQEAVQYFALAAKKALTERVAHAPADRPEKRFLKGWLNRINTYTSMN